MSEPTGAFTRLRVFCTDFNNPELLASVSWYRQCPEVGEPILLVDGDFNVVKGLVKSVPQRPDREGRASGLIHCTADYSTWLDGDECLTLALNLIEQQTRGGIVLRVSLTDNDGIAV